MILDGNAPDVRVNGKVTARGDDLLELRRAGGTT